jgi:predicted DNA-binding transcriptional regulator AlpA
MSQSIVTYNCCSPILLLVTLVNVVGPEVITKTIGKQTESPAPAEARTRRMLTEKQLLAIVPFARSTVWRMERDGRFPKGSYPVNTRRKFWFEDEVVAWQVAMDGQVPQRRRRRPKKPKPAKQTD